MHILQRVQGSKETQAQCYPRPLGRRMARDTRPMRRTADAGKMVGFQIETFRTARFSD